MQLDYIQHGDCLELMKDIPDGSMGSGSTCIAAINTNRHYIGFELDEGYFEIAKKRIEQAQKAVQ